MLETCRRVVLVVVSLHVLHGKINLSHNYVVPGSSTQDAFRFNFKELKLQTQ